MEAVQRYHPIAWTAGVAASASAWLAYFKQDDLSFGAFLLFVAVAAAWIIVKWAAWLGRTGEHGVMRAIAWLALVVFALFAIGIHLWALVGVYPDPALNRIYAESLGIEAGPYIFGSLA